MYLQLTDESINIENFADFLKSYIPWLADNYGLNEYDSSRWDDYLTNHFKAAQRVPTVKGVLSDYFNNQIITISKDTLQLTVDKNKIYTNNYSIDTLAHLINYGNLSIQGYPIFEEIYQYILDHKEEIFLLWVIQNVS